MGNKKRRTIPMKGKLLVSTAALLAGIALASAQEMPRGGGQSGGQPGAAQSQGAPGGGAQERSQSPQNRGGQAQQGMPDRGKQGQSPRDRETTGQAPQKEQGKQGQREEKGKQGQREERGKEGQTQRGQRDRDHTTGQGQRDQSPSQREQGQTQQRQQGPAAGKAEQGRSGSTVNLTTEQRTKIRQTVLAGGNAPRVNNVNFALSVGTVVPTSVHVVEVAPVLVEIHPEWRGYFYFVVGDEIIIVDRGHRIIAVVAV